MEHWPSPRDPMLNICNVVVIKWGWKCNGVGSSTLSGMCGSYLLKYPAIYREIKWTRQGKVTFLPLS
jgi:hypothetical protein